MHQSGEGDAEADRTTDQGEGREWKEILQARLDKQERAQTTRRQIARAEDKHSIGGCQKSEFQRSLQWTIQDTVQKRSRHEDQP
ncbi:hypothetical protein A6U94_27580 [Agrobacterium tumefaciens]|nr:hypothetical protein A6U94_27580 [Agrobacterium tumefaciens]